MSWYQTNHCMFLSKLILKFPVIIRLLQYSRVNTVVGNSSIKYIIFSINNLGGLHMFPIVSLW